MLQLLIVQDTRNEGVVTPAPNKTPLEMLFEASMEAFGDKRLVEKFHDADMVLFVSLVPGTEHQPAVLIARERADGSRRNTAMELEAETVTL